METTIESIVQWIIILFLVFGTFFILSASIGILRFPDVYTRLHASTKAATLGISSTLIGAFLFLYIEHGIISGKLILGIIFIMLTAPISAHMLGRAAHHIGIKPWAKDDNSRDAFAEAKEKNNQK
ncbi:multicomponent Na+:H+ antiporter subunit G [Gracilibacillus halotolerans]|uniref:Multicomponent Na+:H+ antiporter subunit G n=1 Tax=Gracilibacillus halotolerans TaxID=74386 RepID=A0A841RLR2_9BACI|nr:monovalent cation/H(+) antiporter subunit G [Gracilibacillus halotolerans]MBB6511884.1 multicomponent Na+:H+ antiporter subunit G [Gracilibacillus halotolerans]